MIRANLLYRNLSLTSTNCSLQEHDSTFRVCYLSSKYPYLENVSDQKFMTICSFSFVLPDAACCCLFEVSELFRISCRISKSAINTALCVPNQNPQIFPYFKFRFLNPFSMSLPSI